MSININSVFSNLEKGVAGLAKKTVKDFVDEATTDGKQLLFTMKSDVSRWIQLLADKRISHLEFQTPLLGQKDLLEMSSLTQAGLALARIDEFKMGVLNLIIDSVTSLIPV